MIKNKKLIAICFFSFALTLMGQSVKASPRDMKNQNTGKVYLNSDYSTSSTVFNQLMLDIASGDSFTFEMDNRVYDFSRLDAAIGQGKKSGKSVTQVLNDAKSDDSLLISASSDDTTDFDVLKID